MKEKQLDDGGDTNKGRNFELDPNLPKSFCQNCRHPLSIVGVVDSFRLQGSSLQGADSVGFLTYGPFVCRVAKAKVSDTWCFSSSPRRWSSAGNVSVCWCRWDFINNSNTSLTTATLETVSFSVLHEMRPPLTLHQHPMCAEIIEAFQKCHGDHPFVKIFGNCTELKIKLDRCFRQEKTCIWKISSRQRSNGGCVCLKHITLFYFSDIDIICGKPRRMSLINAIDKINYKRVTFGLLTQSGMSIGRIKSKNRLSIEA